jgi:hypothetical protein
MTAFEIVFLIAQFTFANIQLSTSTDAQGCVDAADASDEERGSGENAGDQA